MAAPKMAPLLHERQVNVMRHLRGGNPAHPRIFTAAPEADKVIKSDGTIRSGAGANAEPGTVVIGVDLDAGGTRDPHGRGGTAEEHIQDGRAGHGAREREEIATAVIAGVEGGGVERPKTVL